ncbi:MAG: DUF4476 domain-containing protein [Bacteroidales bacterium]|nr:DUF4476 domain-containing protein [Bacteroidales bacterium]
MKKLVFILSVIYVNCFSQGASVTVFSEKGDKFWLILNGQKINKSPDVRVIADNLMEVSYKVKIIFDDPQIPDVESTIYTKDVDGNFLKATYAIRVKKGKYKLTLISAETISPTQNIGQPTIPQSTQPQQTQQTAVQPAQSSTNLTTMPQTNVTVTETQEGIKLNIQTPGLNIHNQGANVQHQTHTSSFNTLPFKQQQIVMQPTPIKPASTDCTPMADSDFQEALNSISSKNFEDSKLTLAKQITSSNCLKCSQIKAIMKTFSFENTRLEYAKFAYKYAFDKNNYFIINDAFQFESSIDELNEYINSINN